MRPSGSACHQRAGVAVSGVEESSRALTPRSGGVIRWIWGHAGVDQALQGSRKLGFRRRGKPLAGELLAGGVPRHEVRFRPRTVSHTANVEAQMRSLTQFECLVLQQEHPFLAGVLGADMAHRLGKNQDPA